MIDIGGSQQQKDNCFFQRSNYGREIFYSGKQNRFRQGICFCGLAFQETKKKFSFQNTKNCFLPNIFVWIYRRILFLLPKTPYYFVLFGFFSKKKMAYIKDKF